MVSKKYIVEFTEDEIDTLNEIFKISIKKFNLKFSRNKNIKNNKKTDTFFSAINKIYNARK